MGVSVITLRRHASQFEQSRIDTRNDKLRAEVIDLISALSQRSSQVEILIQRIKQLENLDRQTIQQNIKAMFSENLWDPYRRATFHAFAVDLAEKAAVAGAVASGPIRRRHAAENRAQWRHRQPRLGMATFSGTGEVSYDHFVGDFCPMSALGWAASVTHTALTDIDRGGRRNGKC